MFEITKVLNNNTVLTRCREDGNACILMGKGIGFGKKAGEWIHQDLDTVRFNLSRNTSQEQIKDTVEEIDPQYLEIAGEILKGAHREFGQVDESILVPLADHLFYAAKRIRETGQISNPLTSDIRVLFYKEFQVASLARELLRTRAGLEIGEDEIGYIALHVHSAIDDASVSVASQMALTVRACIDMIEKDTGKTIDIQSLDYNRLMNHVKYMTARAIHHEKLKMNINDYMSIKFARSFGIAEKICRQLGKYLNTDLPENEVGYLAMHIERVYLEDVES